MNNYLVKIINENQKIIFKISLNIPNFENIKNLNFRINKIKTINDNWISDPSINNSVYIYNIPKNMLGKKVFFDFIFDKKELLNIKSFCVGFCEENIRWYTDTFKNINVPNVFNIPTITNVKRKEIEDIDIIIECPANRCDGYGNSAHYFSENLSKKKKIRIIPTIHTEDISELFSSLIIDKNNYKKYNPNNYLFFNIPNSVPSLLDSNIKKYILTMFESTKIPSSWPNIINNQFDQLIVPSEFCKNIFIDNGIKVPTHVVNLGVDPNIWPFYNRNFNKKVFNFLLFANAHWENTRKNYQLTLDAFIKAFANNPNVNLIVKLTAGTSKFDNFKYKNVKFIFERYNHKQMLNLVNSSDCMVFVSNGEGFGLPPREAMSTGMPVILMNWSSLSEICKDNISYWINPTSLQHAIYPEELYAMNNGSSDFGEFAKGSSDQLAEVMAHIYNNKDEAYLKGLAASKYIRENETYDLATEKLIKIMDNL